MITPWEKLCRSRANAFRGIISRLLHVGVQLGKDMAETYGLEKSKPSKDLGEDIPGRWNSMQEFLRWEGAWHAGEARRGQCGYSLGRKKEGRQDCVALRQ